MERGQYQPPEFEPYNPGFEQPEPGQDPEGRPNTSPVAPESSSKTNSKTFEELVHAALAEELKFELDPKMRDQASRRADEILVEFNEARNNLNNQYAQPSPENTTSQATSQSRTTNAITPQPSIQPKQDYSTKTPTSNLRLRLADIIMAAIITILLIIIILLLIF